VPESLNPQFYELKSFNIKLKKTKYPEYNDGGLIHRMIPPLNVEVWDKDGSLADGFSSDDILGSIKIDL